MDNKYKTAYYEFCKDIAESMNMDAMKHCNPTKYTAESVMAMPSAVKAFFATLNMAKFITGE